MSVYVIQKCIYWYKFFFFKEEIQKSHENKLKKVFRKIKPKILTSRELYEKFRYILMKLIPKILYWNTYQEKLSR